MKRKQLRNKLERLVKDIVKQRDQNICQKCEREVSGSNCHGSHVIPVSRSLRMSFDIVNLKVLCMRCHIYWWHKNPLEAAEWFKMKFPKRWAYLQERLKEPATPVKDNELQEWIDEIEGIAK